MDARFLVLLLLVSCGGPYDWVGGHLVAGAPEGFADCLYTVDGYTRDAFGQQYQYRVHVSEPGRLPLDYYGRPTRATMERVGHNLFGGREWTIYTMRESACALVAHEVVHHLSDINAGGDGDPLHKRADLAAHGAAASRLASR